jgi:FG-GAP-like repeat/FG-GAP repeat
VFALLSARSGARRGSRLLAACTTAMAAAGAIALAPACAAHADSGAPRGAGISVPRPALRPPTLHLPSRALPSGSSAPAAGTGLTTPRFDADGDGHEDILSQDPDGTVNIWSSGQPADTAWSSPGMSPVRFRDLLTPGAMTADQTGPQILSLTQSGQLSLWNLPDFPYSPLWTGTGWQIYNQVVAVGDVNGDGWGDLLARTPGGDLYLYSGTGDATAPFGEPVRAGRGFGVYDQLVGAGDITGTGHETLVARDLNGDLWMYELDGTAVTPLAPRVRIGYGWNAYNQIIGFGDGPGTIGGLMGRTPSGDLYAYQGDGSGTGTLTPRTLVGSGWNRNTVSGQGHTALYGRADLYGLTSGGDLYHYSGTDTGGLTPRTMVGLTRQWLDIRLLTTVSLTDYDERSLLEIDHDTLYNYVNTYTGVTSTGWSGYSTVLGPGDLNGDGYSDMLARDASGVLWLRPGTGDARFADRTRIGAGWNVYDQITGAGDIDGDGLTDVVARDAATGHLYLYLGTGGGAAPFRPRTDIGAGWNAYTRIAAPGDLDGDGRADIVAATPGGLLYRYSGSGHGGTATFRPRVEIGTAGWNTYAGLF